MAGQTDRYLFHRGEHREVYNYLGASYGRWKSVFRCWAPEAKSVAVVGDFNEWTAREEDYMRKLNAEGIWEVEIAKLPKGTLYKFQIETAWGETLLKADPYAFEAELRPHTASILTSFPKFRWGDKRWMKKREIGFTKPINIYEMHLGSWRRKEDGSYYSYREIVDLVIPYVTELHYTHVEIMPIVEHPLDASWGYQGTGYFAATKRYGTLEDFMYMVNKLHQHKIGVILDWVPGHFCKDAHGLYRFDGSACYEYADPSIGENSWGTANFNLGRNEVKSFLLSNIYFWLKECHVDGIRMDAISEMLYQQAGGQGTESPVAVSFLQMINQRVHEEFPDVALIAEDSSACPLVTKYPIDGGLGFDGKWNMGWMNDTLKYMEQDPFYRKDHHGKLTFSFMYAFSENFVLPLSHDEVVHGKKSILNKMPGYYEDKLKHVKMLFAYQMAHPGKKLQFMGNEFAQGLEWRFDEQLEWDLLEHSEGSQRVHDFVRALNRMYLDEESLWHDGQDGFEWIEHENYLGNMLAFLRKVPNAEDEYLVAVFNFSGAAEENYKIGVPKEGSYECILSSDAMGEKEVQETIPESWNYREQHIRVNIAGHTAKFFKYKAKDI